MYIFCEINLQLHVTVFDLFYYLIVTSISDKLRSVSVGSEAHPWTVNPSPANDWIEVKGDSGRQMGFTKCENSSSLNQTLSRGTHTPLPFFLYLRHHCAQINQRAGGNECWFLIGWFPVFWGFSTNEKSGFIFPNPLIYLSIVLESVDQM